MSHLEAHSRAIPRANQNGSLGLADFHLKPVNGLEGVDEPVRRRFVVLFQGCLQVHKILHIYCNSKVTQICEYMVPLVRFRRVDEVTVRIGEWVPQWHGVSL